MINKNLELSSGLTFTPQSDLNSINERSIATIVINSLTGASGTVNRIEEDLEAIGLKDTDQILPSKLSFGLGLGKSKKWFIGTEYTSQKASKFSSRIFSTENVTFEDANTFAFGGFYIPQYNSLTSYWKRVLLMSLAYLLE